MSPTRTLLLALLLPAIVLPEGMTLCLKRLLGEPAPATAREGCCNRCCASPDAQHPPATLHDDRCASCCVAMPETGRSVEPTPRKVEHDLAPIFVLAPPPRDFLDRAAPIASARSRALEHGPPPAASPPISLPLRL